MKRARKRCWRILAFVLPANPLLVGWIQPFDAIGRASHVLDSGLLLLLLSRSPRIILAWISILATSLETQALQRHSMSNDHRIQFSIGSGSSGTEPGELGLPRGLAFDERLGLLYVVDNLNDRTQGFSCDDGSFVCLFGRHSRPWGIAIDHKHDRLLVTEMRTNRLQSWSLCERSLVSTVGRAGSNHLEFMHPQGVALDKRHDRVVVAEAGNERLQVLSSVDLSFVFSIGREGGRPGEFFLPSAVAVDHERGRIVVADQGNNRMQVLSAIDGSFLFEFGSRGTEPGLFKRPQGVCIANHGRIIVADADNARLQAFTHDGRYISSFDCGREKPWTVAYDEHRGLIAFAAVHRVHVIGANRWLAGTFTWRVDRHRYAPKEVRHVVLIITMIRSLIHETTFSLLPNELLFEIFEHLYC